MQYLSLLGPFRWIHQWCEENPLSRKTYKKSPFEFDYFQIPLEIARKAGGEADSSPGWFVMFEDGTPFKLVVEGLLPDWTLPSIALHEHGEELSSGNHFMASRLEFASVEKDRKTRDYVRAINTAYPGKFVDLLEPVEIDLPEEIIEKIEERMHKNQSVEDQHAAMMAMVDRFEIPSSVKKLAERYHEHNKTIGDLVECAARQCERMTEFYASSIGRGFDREAFGKEVVKSINWNFSAIPDAYMRVARPQLLKGYEEIFKKIVYKSLACAIKGSPYDLRMKGNLEEAIAAAKRGEDAAEARILV